MKTEKGTEMTGPTKTDLFLLRMAEVTEPITATEMRAGDRPLVGAQDKDKAGAMLSRLVSSGRLKRRFRGGENSGGPYEHLLPDVPWPEDVVADDAVDASKASDTVPPLAHIPHTDVPCSEEEKAPPEHESADPLLDVIRNIKPLKLENAKTDAARLRALADTGVLGPMLSLWTRSLADKIEDLA